ncbi:hypothetical protein SDC9_86246 [bioreactor metagenome]|uniref:Uncharacterized protein n=1 Tax=bioreactor metagenome TaxID=1076179 RepID=A0A644ZFF3_9ZZZZ
MAGRDAVSGSFFTAVQLGFFEAHPAGPSGHPLCTRRAPGLHFKPADEHQRHGRHLYGLPRFNLDRVGEDD